MVVHAARTDSLAEIVSCCHHKVGLRAVQELLGQNDVHTTLCIDACRRTVWPSSGIAP